MKISVKWSFMGWYLYSVLYTFRDGRSYHRQVHCCSRSSLAYSNAPLFERAYASKGRRLAGHTSFCSKTLSCSISSILGFLWYRDVLIFFFFYKSSFILWLIIASFIGYFSLSIAPKFSKISARTSKKSLNHGSNTKTLS